MKPMNPWNLLRVLLVGVSVCPGCASHDNATAIDAGSDAESELDADLDAGSIDDSNADAEFASGDAALPTDAAPRDAAIPCEEPESGLPNDLFCTGLYVDRDASQTAANVMPYTPGVVFWSDGAEKHRYLYLPAGSKIDTSNLDAWRFPVGTKAWKEFRIDGALVETRLFWKRGESAWASGTYLWDSAGNATLNKARKGIILDGGYEIPEPRDCDKCHHGGADKLLGVEALAFALPTAVGVTLAGLVDAGFVSHPPEKTTVELPEDSTGKAGAALGYLHANCGMPCHSARGLGDETQLRLRLRADEFWPAGAAFDAGVAVDAALPSDAEITTPATVLMTEIYRATVNRPPTTASVAQAFPDAGRITPGSHEQSLVWQLAHRRGNYQMPPLVSHRIDDAGTQRLADWIDSLPK